MEDGWTLLFITSRQMVELIQRTPIHMKLEYDIIYLCNKTTPLFRFCIKREFRQFIELPRFKFTQDEPCRYKSQTSGASDYGFLDVAKGDEEALQAATAEIGPISVGIDATHESFQQYRYIHQQSRLFIQ